MSIIADVLETAGLLLPGQATTVDPALDRLVADAYAQANPEWARELAARVCEEEAIKAGQPSTLSATKGEPIQAANWPPRDSKPLLLAARILREVPE